MIYYDRELGLNGSFNRSVNPANQLVTLGEVKDFLSLSGTGQDNMLNSLIFAAREVIESHIDKTAITTTWKLVLDNYPTGDVIPLVRGPLQAVVSVTSIGTDGTPVLFDSSNYYLDTESENGAIVLKDGRSYPSLSLQPKNGVEIIFTSGFGDNISDIPENIRVATMSVIEQIFEGCPDPLPMYATAMLSEYVELM